MASAGFNFRSTSGYVTDGAGQIYVLGADSYPTTRGGWTFGYESSAPGAIDRDSAGDPRLAGIHYALFAEKVFRIDLPATGDYTIRAAFGDATSGQQVPWIFRDDTTSFASTTGATGGANQFKDATNVNRASQAIWIADNATLARTFASTVLRLESNNDADLVAITHLYVEQAGGGGGLSIPVAMHHLRQQGIA